MRKFGLAAILEFVDKGATAAMGRLGRAASALKTQFAGIGRGAAFVGRGLGSIALASAPVTAAFGLMLRDGMKFETAMSKLRAVSLDTTGDMTKGLESLAKTMGATTKFSASEAVDAMTALKRAGLEVDEVAGAVEGTLAAAAAEGIGLAEAADMVASNLRGFSIDAKEAASVAGVLALTSARTNTNMSELQQGLKFASVSARQVGAPLADTAAILGSLADIGLKATLSGTAFRTAITRLIKPTKEAKSGIAQLGISMDVVSELIDQGDVVGLFTAITNKLGKFEKRSKRAAIAAKIFGVRGLAIGSALDKANLAKFNKTLAELRKETGATAKTMVEIMMLPLSQKIVLFRSALEATNNALFTFVGSGFSSGIARITLMLSNLSVALRVVQGEQITDPKTLAILEKMPPVYLEIAKGIKEGFEAAKSAISSVIASLKSVAKWFGFTGDSGARGIAAVVTKFALLLAAIGPVSIALFGVTKLLGGFGSIALGVVKILGPLLGILGPVGIVGALLALSMGLDNARALWQGFTNAISGSGVLGELWNQIKGLGRAFGRLLASILGVQGSTEGWKTFGTVVGAAFAAILKVIERVVAGWRAIIDLYNEIRSGDLGRFFSQALGGKGFRQAAASPEDVAKTTARQISANLAGIKSGFVTEAGGERRAVTRGFAEAKIAETLRRNNFTQEQIAGALASISTQLARFPATRPAKTTPTPAPAGDALVRSGGYVNASPGDVLLDRAELAAAVTSRTPGGLLGAATAGALGTGDPGRVSPSPASAGGGGGTYRIEVPLTVDGRELARAVAEVQLDELERGGRLRPGDRSLLLSGNLSPVGAGG